MEIFFCERCSITGTRQNLVAVKVPEVPGYVIVCRTCLEELRVIYKDISETD